MLGSAHKIVLSVDSKLRLSGAFLLRDSTKRQGKVTIAEMGFQEVHSLYPWKSGSVVRVWGQPAMERRELFGALKRQSQLWWEGFW